MRVGVDVGGTFTDFVLLDDASGQIHTYKCLTTPRDPAAAIAAGIEALAERLPGLPARLEEVILAMGFEMVSVLAAQEDDASRTQRAEILDRLGRGEITSEEALALLHGD